MKQAENWVQNTKFEINVYNSSFIYFISIEHRLSRSSVKLNFCIKSNLISWMQYNSIYTNFI